MTHDAYLELDGPDPFHAAPLWIVVAVWGLAIAVAAVAGVLAIEIGGVPVYLLAAVIVPPIVFALLYRTSTGLQNWVARLDLVTVVGMQAWRILGGTFVFLWLLGQLPAAFAIPAGFGDVAVGIAAVFVTARVARKANAWKRSVRWLILFGMLDFGVALTTGILTRQAVPLPVSGLPSGDIMQVWPMVMIPGFAVPVFIILHMIAWNRLRNDAS